MRLANLPLVLEGPFITGTIMLWSQDEPGTMEKLSFFFNVFFQLCNSMTCWQPSVNQQRQWQEQAGTVQCSATENEAGMKKVVLVLALSI